MRMRPSGGARFQAFGPVITPALKGALRGAAKGIGPVILDRNCTNCGRCIDVCSKDVFEFGTRFGNRASKVSSNLADAKEVS